MAIRRKQLGAGETMLDIVVATLGWRYTDAHGCR
jgi:hypothetical protein